ncbi:ABC transporter substrate-binding protein [Sphingorhabdus sp. Alg239-R122]|uniref:ABC transporter substrate-binding protein n=1 Tax=Sphingorhabdus sp. Alg239-R122 TaxID=2305989 RepID=UPI0013D9A4FB|nr:ABC transporter substrate-binding protein [Sphingorhabdus sp. Alg239-R122]
MRKAADTMPGHIALSVKMRCYTGMTALLLASCGSNADQTLDISVIDNDSSIFNTERSNLSPGPRLVRGAVAQGLVAHDSTGQLVPALAARWIVTDDGQSFIFRLKDTKWADGSEVTARQVAGALRERIKMERQGRLGRDLSEIRDIRSMTGRVVEIRLSSADPDLLQILAQPEMGISRNGLGTGPLTKVVTGQRIDFMVPVDERDEDTDDVPNPEIPALTLRADTAAQAISRYQMDFAEIVTGGRFQNLPLISIAQVNRSEIRIDPVSGLFGLLFVEDSKFLSDSVVREAISMAVDRSRFRTALNIETEDITNRIIPDFVDDYDSIAEEPWNDLGMAARRSVAKRRIDGWVANNGETPVLRIALPQGPGADMLFATVNGDLQAIGLISERVAHTANADLRLIDEVASYNGVAWYLNQLSCGRRNICDKKGDTLLKQAKSAIDLSERARIMAQVEQSMASYHSFIVLGQPIRWSLIKEEYEGFALNPLGYHPLPNLAVIPK